MSIGGCIICDVDAMKDGQCFWCVVGQGYANHPIMIVCVTCAKDRPKLEMMALHLLVENPT